MILAKMFVTGTLFFASYVVTAYNVLYMCNSFLLTVWCPKNYLIN